MSGEVKYCRKGHKKTQVGRGSKKHWVCNRCRSEARRGRSAGTRRARLSYETSWMATALTSSPTPTGRGSFGINSSYYDRPEDGGETP